MSRSFMKALAPAAALIGALAVVSPASATDTSFATYTGLNGTFKATTTPSTVTFKETGTVKFSFLNTSLATTFAGVNATVSFLATSPAADYSGTSLKDQSAVSGTYTFTSQSAYTVNGIFHPVGSNLLTAVFTNGDVYGRSHTASLVADNTVTGETVTYTSDFLSFINTNAADFSVGLSAVLPSFGGSPKLAPFKGTPVGVFSADPVPLVIGQPVPEPATWVMMLVGFGAIGLGIRGNARRNLRTA